MTGKNWLVLASSFWIFFSLSFRLAWADVIASDSLSYVSGQTLYGQSGGTGWTAIWTGSGMVIDSGRAVGAVWGNPPLYGSRNFDNPETGPWIFVSAELTMPAGLGLADYAGVSTGTGVNLQQIDFGKRSGSDLLSLNGVETNVFALPGETYHLIGAYNFQPAAPDTMLFWVNPDTSDFLDLGSLDSSADVSIVGLISVHAFYVNIFGNLPGTAFDNIRIADSPTDVGIRITAVPEPGYGVVLGGLAGLGTSRNRRVRRWMMN